MKRILYTTVLLISLFSVQQLMAQGCVAIRGTACSVSCGDENTLAKGEFQVGSGLRYFKSFRHFRGTTEEANRVEQGTEVINHSYFLDLSINYGITNRLYANAVIPFVHHTRSSMYEHGGNPPNGLGERHETSSKGLADARLGLGFWLFKPKADNYFNYAVGIGVKLPTGKADYTDIFYNQGPNKDQDVAGVVDQSIQPGDGGTGIALDVQGYHIICKWLTLTTNLYYMISPRETNGVKTRGGNGEFSCPDQYAVRLGGYFSVPVKGLSAYLGGRMEGIPSSDLIGGSAGFRRPGYAVSVEPGLSYTFRHFTFNANVPVAVKRARVQSYDDKQRTASTGVFTQGDAAFADYLLSFGVAYRFGGKHNMASPAVPAWKNVEPAKGH